MGGRQFTSPRPICRTESDCRHPPCRLCINAVADDRGFVALKASGSDEQRGCDAVFSLAIPDGIASAVWERRGAPTEVGARQSSSPVPACIMGALRLCAAPMISSEEIPSR